MSERLKREGRLLEYRQKARKLELKLDGLRDSIRDTMDPDEKLEHTKGEVVSQQAMEFWSVQQRYKEILEEIARIERDLGIGS